MTLAAAYSDQGHVKVPSPYRRDTREIVGKEKTVCGRVEVQKSTYQAAKHSASPRRRRTLTRSSPQLTHGSHNLDATTGSDESCSESAVADENDSDYTSDEADENDHVAYSESCSLHTSDSEYDHHAENLQNGDSEDETVKQTPAQSVPARIPLPTHESPEHDVHERHSGCSASCSNTGSDVERSSDGNETTHPHTYSDEASRNTTQPASADCERGRKQTRAKNNKEPLKLGYSAASSNSSNHTDKQVHVPVCHKSDRHALADDLRPGHDSNSLAVQPTLGVSLEPMVERMSILHTNQSDTSQAQKISPLMELSKQLAELSDDQAQSSDTSPGNCHRVAGPGDPVGVGDESDDTLSQQSKVLAFVAEITSEVVLRNTTTPT